MISLVFALAVQAATAVPAARPTSATWAADARCAAALAVEAEKPDKVKTGAERGPVIADPLPVEALLKMNRAAGAARAEGLERSVVERGVAAFKAEYRRFDADHPAEFLLVVRSCRLARAKTATSES